MRMPSIALALTLLAATAGTACAQERVYRCGNSYSQQACGAALVVAVDDTRSEAQRQAALRVLARDQQAAETLARERRQREAATGRQGAAHIGPARAASAPEKAARPKSPRKPDGRRTHENARLSPPLKVIAPAG